jgi:hypothetical protein
MFGGGGCEGVVEVGAGGGATQGFFLVHMKSTEVARRPVHLG